jgi:hypothetical protein
VKRSDPFSSARLSVEHAKRHIATVEQLSNAWIKSGPYTSFRKQDPLYATHELEYLRLAKPVPAEVSLYASDAVQNLRAALDQIGYAVAIAAGRSGGNAHFPFGDSIFEVEKRRTGRSKQIPKEIFDLMIAFKPYKGGNDALWRLNKLANVKKHEKIVRAAARTTEMIYETDGIMFRKAPQPEATETYIPIAWFRKGGPQVKYHIKLNTFVRFSDVGNLVFDQPAVGFLHQLSGIVTRIIGGVEKESNRTGLFK